MIYSIQSFFLQAINKLYIADNYHPEVYDLTNNTWRLWPLPYAYINFGSCLVLFKDSFLLFDYSHVQKFNLTTQTWSVVTYTTSLYVHKTASITLPSEEVLLLGFSFGGGRTAYLFNTNTKSFRRISDSNFDQSGATLIQLVQRIFAIGGSDTVMEEFK